MTGLASGVISGNTVGMSVLPNRLYKLALELFGHLPGGLRRLVVRLVTPHYAVGAVIVLRHSDNVLFVRSRHTRAGWTLPGGLMRRGELPRDAVRREVCEELGLDVEVDEQPTFTLVDPACRRIDLVYEVVVAVPPSVRVDGTEAVAACWLPVTTDLEDPTALAAIGSLLSRDQQRQIVLPEVEPLVPAQTEPLPVGGQEPAAAGGKQQPTEGEDELVTVVEEEPAAVSDDQPVGAKQPAAADEDEPVTVPEPEPEPEPATVTALQTVTGNDAKRGHVKERQVRPTKAAG